MWKSSVGAAIHKPSYPLEWINPGIKQDDDDIDLPVYSHLFDNTRDGNVAGIRIDLALFDCFRYLGEHNPS